MFTAPPADFSLWGTCLEMYQHESWCLLVRTGTVFYLVISILGVREHLFKLRSAETFLALDGNSSPIDDLVLAFLSCNLFCFLVGLSH